MRRRAAILISGRGSNMSALISAMAATDYPAETALVLSNAPDAPGLARAAEAGIATATVDHRGFRGDRPGFEAAMTEALSAAEIDLICLAGFMRLLTPGFVEAWRDRLVNIHPSLLPSYKGLDTHARALADGVAFHGCSVHLVRAEMDEGPILGQAALQVGPKDDAESLAARVLAMEHRLYPAVLAAYLTGEIRIEEGRATPCPISIIETGAV